MSNVPRVHQITKAKSREELAAEREWQRERKRFRDLNAKHAFGTPEAKAAWKARIQRTRSF